MGAMAWVILIWIDIPVNMRIVPTVAAVRRSARVLGPTSAMRTETNPGTRTAMAAGNRVPIHLSGESLARVYWVSAQAAKLSQEIYRQIY
jgi:hypothetical protein